MAFPAALIAVAETPACAQLTDEHVRLLGFQAALEKEEAGRASFVGLSLNETIRQCLVKGNVKRAEKLRADWKVPEKRFWR